MEWKAVRIRQFPIVSLLMSASLQPEGTENYNYGDEFLFVQEMINRRKAVCDEIYKIEKEEGKEYPNFSMWVDEAIFPRNL